MFKGVGRRRLKMAALLTGIFLLFGSCGTVRESDGGSASEEISLPAEDMTPEEAMEQCLNTMESAFVRIAGDGNGRGSGFVLEKRTDELWLCTNQHVVETKTRVDVIFYDGTKAEGQVLATNYGLDIALLSVALADLPAGLAEEIVPVKADEDYWNDLPLIGSLTVGFRTIGMDGGVWQDRIGTMLDKDTAHPRWDPLWRDLHTMTLVDLELFNGSSGAAILDTEGHLIAMATLAAEDQDMVTYWGVPLPDILEFYKNVAAQP